MIHKKETNRGDQQLANQGARTHRSQEEISSQRRRELLDAAIKSVAANGITGTTVKTISVAANAPGSLIAHHYGNKGTLLVEAYRFLCKMAARNLSKASQHQKLDAVGQLRVRIDRCFLPPSFDPVWQSAYLSFWHEAQHEQAFAEVHKAEMKKTREDHLKLFRQAFAEGRIMIDPEIALTGYLAMIDGLWIQILLEDELSAQRASQTCHAYLDMLLTSEGEAH